MNFSQNKLLKWGFFVVSILILIYLVSQKEVTTTYQISGINYAWPNNLDPSAAPKEIGRFVDLVKPKSLLIKFSFTPLDDNYDNLFQTGNSYSAIRMELNHPGKLSLVLGDDVELIPLFDGIKLGQKYDVEFQYEFGKRIRVIINGVERADIHADEIKKLRYDLSDRYDFSEFVVGTGFSQQRQMRGEINNFNIYFEYVKNGTINKILNSLLAIYFLSVLVFVTYKLKHQFPDITNNQQNTFIEILAIFGWGLSFVLIGLGFVYVFKISKWIPHILLLISVLITAFSTASIQEKIHALIHKMRYPFGGLVIVGSLAALFIGFTSFKAYPILALLPIAMGVGSLVYLSLQLNTVAELSNIFEKTLTSILFGIIGVLAWYSIFDLPNWVEYVTRIKQNNSAVEFAGFVALILATTFLFNRNRLQLKKEFSWNGQILINKYIWLIHLGVIAIFFWMSFRYDSLFLGTSDLHWEYYVGPVRTVKSGGWLLWNTPSQYGFLNILLASVIPSATGWQSFYVFQSILLFVVSSSCYLAAIYFVRKGIIDTLVAIFVVFIGVFFADPDLIGPYLYPSSSVMRFFWCYVLILYLIFFPKFTYKQFWLIATCWAISVWWSLESAVYSSSILFMATIARVHLGINSQEKDNALLRFAKYISISLFILSAISATIFLYYKEHLDAFPDIYAYFEYAFSYASGFGSTATKWNGPIIFLLLYFIGLFLVYMGIYKVNKKNPHLVTISGIMGCLWAISTYYVGRSYPSNITALLPIFGIMAYFAILITREESIGYYGTILKASTFPLMFLLVFPALTPRVITTIYNSDSLSSDITTQFNSAEDELGQLMSVAKITENSPVTFYGNSAALPKVYVNGKRYVNKITWLQAPMQLLEEPISTEHRNIYLERFVHRNYKPGYLIQRNGDSPERFNSWLEIIEKFYKVDKIYKGNKFTIWHFVPL